MRNKVPLKVTLQSSPQLMASIFFLSSIDFLVCVQKASGNSRRRWYREQLTATLQHCVLQLHCNTVAYSYTLKHAKLNILWKPKRDKMHFLFVSLISQLLWNKRAYEGFPSFCIRMCWCTCLIPLKVRPNDATLLHETRDSVSWSTAPRCLGVLQVFPTMSDCESWEHTASCSLDVVEGGFGPMLRVAKLRYMDSH